MKTTDLFKQATSTAWSMAIGLFHRPVSMLELLSSKSFSSLTN
ncbi:MAG: hypothetical protein ACK5HK_08630 [Pseudanabaena sp.]